MKTFLSYGLMLVLWVSLALPTAQAQCDYDALMRDGRARFKDDKFHEAMNKFNAARTCDPSHSAEVDKEIEQVFNEIENQKNAAVRSEQRAKKARDEAQKARVDAVESARQAQLAQRAAQQAQEETEQARKKADSQVLAFRSRDSLDIDATTALCMVAQAVTLDPSTFAYQALFKPFYQFHYCKELQSNGLISTVSAAPTGDRFAVGLTNAQILLYDENLEQQGKLLGHVGEIKAIAFSPDSLWIVSAAADHQIKVWNRRGQYKLTLKQPLMATACNAIYFPPDQPNVLMTGSVDGVVRRWDTRTWQQMDELTTPGMGDVQQVLTNPLDHSMAVLAAGTLWLWSVDRTPLPMPAQPGNISALAASPDGRSWVAGDKDGRVAFLDTHGRLTDTLEFRKGIISIIFLTDADLLITCEDGNVVLYNREIKFQDLRPWHAHRQRLLDMVALGTFNQVRRLLTTDGDRLRLWNLQNMPTPITSDGRMRGIDVNDCLHFTWQPGQDSSQVIMPDGQRAIFLPSKKAKTKILIDNTPGDVIRDTLQMQQFIVEAQERHQPKTNLPAGSTLRVVDAKGEEVCKLDDLLPGESFSEIAVSTDENYLLWYCKNSNGQESIRLYHTPQYMYQYAQKVVFSKL